MAWPFYASDKVRVEPARPAAAGSQEFADLFAQFDAPSDDRMVDGGYSELMARITSPTYRRRVGRE